MTSRYHDNDFSGDRRTDMAALSITGLASFFIDEPKSIARGENHHSSGHIESFTYIVAVLRGSFHASMKTKSYTVTVKTFDFVVFLLYTLCASYHLKRLHLFFKRQTITRVVSSIQGLSSSRPD